MIRHFPHSAINKQRWDQWILRSPQHIPYAESWYLDVVCPGWEALIDEQQEVCMPLTAGKKYGIAYLFQPFFTQQLGVFAPQEIPAGPVDAMLQAIPKAYRYIDIQLNIHNQVSQPGFHQEKRVTYQLPSAADAGALRSGYHENTRRKLKKFEQQATKYEAGTCTPAELVALFRKETGSRIPELRPRHYRMLVQLIGTALSLGKGFISCFRNPEGDLSAGAFFLQSGNYCINLLPAGTAAGRRDELMTGLLDAQLSRLAGSRVVFDFEGSSIPSVARFYRGFGSSEVFYLHLRQNHLPPLLKLFKK